MKALTLTLVKSSHIQAVGFDASGLHVQFKDGGHFVYSEATADLHKKMMEAESVGSFFAKHVRGTLAGKKFDAQPHSG